MDTSSLDKESGPSPGYGEHNLGQIYRPDPFLPVRGIRSGHLQTIVSHFLSRKDRLPAAESRLVETEPGVRVICRCHWQSQRSQALTVVIVHGLEGSSESQYVIGTANKAWAAGMNAVRMNVRNCGGTESLAPTLYHSGMSADVGAVVRQLIASEGLTHVAVVGFSMGGNQVLKLAGEWGSRLAGDPPNEVRAFAAVSPAMDLAVSSDALHLPANRLYELRFLFSLRARLRRKVALFPDRFHVSRFWWKSVREFDDRVTAPHCGFRDAEDYYTQASSSRLLDRISKPTIVINAADDPFIRVLPETRAKLTSNPMITYVETESGGHCGFLAAARDGDDGRWAERQVISFFSAIDRSSRGR